jgi:hypothetical protein
VNKRAKAAVAEAFLPNIVRDTGPKTESSETVNWQVQCHCHVYTASSSGRTSLGMKQPAQQAARSRHLLPRQRLSMAFLSTCGRLAPWCLHQATTESLDNLLFYIRVICNLSEVIYNVCYQHTVRGYRECLLSAYYPTPYRMFISLLSDSIQNVCYQPTIRLYIECLLSAYSPRLYRISVISILSEAIQNVCYQHTLRGYTEYLAH